MRPTLVTHLLAYANHEPEALARGAGRASAGTWALSGWAGDGQRFNARRLFLARDQATADRGDA